MFSQRTSWGSAFAPSPPRFSDLAPWAAFCRFLNLCLSAPLPSFGRGKQGVCFGLCRNGGGPMRHAIDAGRGKRTHPLLHHNIFTLCPQPLSLFFLSDLLPLSSLLLGGANAEFLGLSRGAQFDSESQSTSMEEIEIVLFLFGKLRLIVDQQSGRRHFQRNFAFPFYNFGFRIVRGPHIVGYVAAREFQNNFGVPRDWCRMNVFSLYMVCGARKRDRKR